MPVTHEPWLVVLAVAATAAKTSTKAVILPGGTISGG
jgi:hypothetical protein